MVSWIKAFLGDLVVSDETLALDEIAATGPAGNYPSSKHTQKHFREVWYPDLFERDTYLNWEKQGSMSMLERASGRVDKILAEHQPEPLPLEVRRRLLKNVKQAEVP